MTSGALSIPIKPCLGETSMTTTKYKTDTKSDKNQKSAIEKVNATNETESKIDLGKVEKSRKKTRLHDQYQTK